MKASIRCFVFDIALAFVNLKVWILHKRKKLTQFLYKYLYIYIIYILKLSGIFLLYHFAEVRAVDPLLFPPMDIKEYSLVYPIKWFPPFLKHIRCTWEDTIVISSRNPLFLLFNILFFLWEWDVPSNKTICLLVGGNDALQWALG